MQQLIESVRGTEQFGVAEGRAEFHPPLQGNANNHNATRYATQVWSKLPRSQFQGVGLRVTTTNTQQHDLHDRFNVKMPKSKCQGVGHKVATANTRQH